MTQDAWINLILLSGCVGFFAWRGYRRGAIRSVQGLLSILSAYAASYFLVGIFATFLQKSFALPSPLSYLFAVLVLFFGTSSLVRFLLDIYIRRLENRDEEQGNEQDDEEWEPEQGPARALGAVIGGVVGCLLGLVLVWFSGIMMDTVQLKQKGVQSFSGRQIDPLRKLAGNVIGAAAGFVVAQKTGENSSAPTMIAKLISDPVDMTQQLGQLKNSEDIKRIQSDPRFVALSQKPEFQALLEHPTPEAILASPLLKELTDIIFSQGDQHALVPEQEFEAVKKNQWQKVQDEPTQESAGQLPDDDGRTIYRWTDEQGVKHFSQKKPDGNYALEIIRTE